MLYKVFRIAFVLMVMLVMAASAGATTKNLAVTDKTAAGCPVKIENVKAFCDTQNYGARADTGVWGFVKVEPTFLSVSDKPIDALRFRVIAYSGFGEKCGTLTVDANSPDVAKGPYLKPGGKSHIEWSFHNGEAAGAAQKVDVAIYQVQFRDGTSWKEPESEPAPPTPAATPSAAPTPPADMQATIIQDLVRRVGDLEARLKAAEAEIVQLKAAKAQ
jgi:hypothetical protein